ncbi:MAG: NfeD family protein [Chlamydiota bacterium]|nr:NfeD family protein [Chlamydiota bacterium]
MIWVVGFLLAGLLMVYIEWFLPGGIFGCLGGVSLLASVGVSFSQGWSSSWLMGYLCTMGILLWGTIRCALWRIRSHEGTLYAGDDQEGFTATSYASSLLGKEGVALTPLRPSGHALIEGQRIQVVVSQGGFLPEGSALRVIGGEGGRLIVHHTTDHTIGDHHE